MTGRFVGRKNGRYSAALAGHGFVDSVDNVATAAGVRDAVGGSDGTITFDGGMSRALTVGLAQRARTSGAAAWSAKLATHADGGRSEAAALTPSGTLSLVHGGASTTISFTLTSTRSGTFASGPVPVGGGDRVTVTPAAGLRSARVTLRGRSGVHTILVRNHAMPPARLTLSRPRLTGSRVTLRVGITASARARRDGRGRAHHARPDTSLLARLPGTRACTTDPAGSRSN